MKTVALIHYRFLKKGGLESRLFNYIEYFVRHGYQVTVLATKMDPNLSLPPNVTYKRISIGPIPKIFRQLFFARAIERFLSTNTFDYCLSLGRTFGQPLIIDGGNHTGYMKCLNIKRKSLKDRINLYLDKKAYNQSRTIFACSRFVKNFNIDGYQTDPDKIVIAYPPINIEKFNTELRKNRDALKEEFGINRDKITFLFVSTGHIMKNLRFLLELFNHLDSTKYELIIAGSKPKKKLPPNAKYIGYVDHPRRIYSSVDFTIHPALYEPFGQVIAESIQCGTPVIVSKNVGAKELIESNEGLIIRSFKLKDWIETVKNLDASDFSIKEGFAQRNGITLEQHMSILLEQNT